MKDIFLRSCVVLSLLLPPLSASAGCYTPQESQAEGLLRLHSELMVITVTCETTSQGIPLAPAYTSFTQRYKGAIQNAEAVMQAHYESAEKGRGIERLDELRTRLANAVGQRIAQQKAPFFCAVNRDKVVAVNSLSPASVEQAAVRIGADAGTLEPACAFRKK